MSEANALSDFPFGSGTRDGEVFTDTSIDSGYLKLCIAGDRFALRLELIPGDEVILASVF